MSSPQAAERTSGSPLTAQNVVVGVLALFAGALVGITLLNRMPEEPKQGLLAVAQLSAQTEILAVGASHVYTAIDPTLTGRPWVNLSTGLLNYVFVDAVVAEHAAKLSNLRAVVLDFDPLCVFADSYGVAKGDYRHLLDLAPNLSALDEPIGRRASLARDRFLMYQEPFRRAFLREKAEFDYLHRIHVGIPEWATIFAGHEGFVGQREGGLHGAERAKGHYKVAFIQDYIPKNLAAFKRIVARVKALHVPLVLVRFPLHHSYREASPPAFAQTFALLEQAANEASPDAPLPVLDYTREPTFGDEEFYDGDHLNQTGAARLTPRLAADLEALLQRRQDSAAR